MNLTRRCLLAAGSMSIVPGAHAQAPSLSPSGPVVSIVTPPAGDCVPALIAQDKGFFAEAGLKAAITILPLIGNIPPAILSGSAQIGATTGPVFLQAVDNGLDLVAVAGGSRMSKLAPTWSLLAAKGSDITKPADLRGKKIGIPGLNSFAELIFRRWLLQNDIKLEEVTMLETPLPQMGNLMRNRTLDAALLGEPFRDSAISQGAGTRIADYMAEVADNMLGLFWIASRDWADANGPAITAFRAGLLKGSAFLSENPEGRAIEAKYFHFNAKVLPLLDIKMTADDLRWQQDLVAQFGLVSTKPDPSKLLTS